LAVAVPFLGLVLRAAWDRERPVRDVLALGLLAAFFVAPYARYYDYPVLLIPLFILLGGRLSEKASMVLLMVLIAVPYPQFMLLVRYSRLYTGGINAYVEWTYIWLPMLLVALWYATAAKPSESRA
jgi:hypothetical protein